MYDLFKLVTSGFFEVWTANWLRLLQKKYPVRYLRLWTRNVLLENRDFEIQSPSSACVSRLRFPKENSYFETTPSIH